MDIKKDQTSLEEKLEIIKGEFKQGIEAVKDLENSVTFYGGARFPEDHEVYKKVRSLAYRISKELGYTILSGGGGGIMEASSRGASEAGGKSIGLTIRLQREQKPNKYLSKFFPFSFFFARQTGLSYATEACIFCPGGFGTLSELFEILTAEQTLKIGRIPVILFDREYWEPLDKVIKEVLLDKYGTIRQEERDIYKIMDDEDEILEIVKNSNRRDGNDTLN